MLRTIAIVLLILWLLGLLVHIGGSLIHLVLLIAVIVFVYDLIAGRRGGGGTPTNTNNQPPAA